MKTLLALCLTLLSSPSSKIKQKGNVSEIEMTKAEFMIFSNILVHEESKESIQQELQSIVIDEANNKVNVTLINKEEEKKI